MRDKEISIFKTIYKTDVPYIITLEKCFDRIKNGKSKERVESIRSGNAKDKNHLPAIVFGGVFSERNKKGLINHSGLMVVDFDKFPNNETLKEYFDKLTNLKEVVSVFVSPSGNGIKGVVKIPECDAAKHEKYFKAFNEEYDFDYFDAATLDVSRVCFESYDPDIYINYEAETFSPELIDSGFTVKEKVPLLPLTDGNKIINLIMNFKWGKSFVPGERNNYILDVSGAFCEYGVSQHEAISYLSSYISDDFTQYELETTIKSSYKRRTANSKFFEDNSAIKKIENDLKKGKDFVIEKHNIDEETFLDISNEFVDSDFWTVDNKGKINIEPLRYKTFLERNGFKKHFPDGTEKSNFVFIESNKVEDTTPEKIKDFVLEYLSLNSEFDVWNYCANFANLFSDSYLTMLQTIELSMLKDTKTKSYMIFNNGILEVTKDGSRLIDFIDVDGYVWKNQIIKRDFIESEETDNDYKVFINNISNQSPLAIECVIGYLLSNYKNKMNNKAIILNDEVISDNPEGGTGKGVFIQGVKQLRRTAILDGKSFDDKKSFPYQTVKQETNILVFDDVKKNFNFESKFSLVTEGLTLERKNKDAIKLSVEDSPKLVISTNYAIKGEGNSHDRRRHEIEFSQYYNGDRTPFDEFGCQLFDDWGFDEWVAFDNYMVECLQMYLQNGLLKQNAKNIKLRKLIAESSMEFFEWVEDDDNFTLDVRYNKVEKFEAFTSEFKDFERWLTRKKFNIWFKKYAAFKDYEYSEGNTNGVRWFELKNDKDV